VRISKRTIPIKAFNFCRLYQYAKFKTSEILIKVCYFEFHSYFQTRSELHSEELTHSFSATGFHFSMNIMAPRKAPKKSEEAGESSNPDGDVILDTTPHVVDAIKSWRNIFENLDYEIRNCPDDFGNEKTKNKLRDIAESELHKVATRSRLVPYNDMIGWAL
jgi:hypothetical protein